MTVHAILEAITKYTCKQVCVTGGEPLVQKETLTLINTLLKMKYKVSLETNGSVNIKNIVGKKSFIISLDIKCPSSGSQEYMNLENILCLSKKDQLKFIIKNKQDYLYAKQIIQKYQPICTVLFQPVWGTDPQRLASWILSDALQVRLSLQIHKIIWGTKKGV
jgi:7-carboxy-7-deazaguanine synthase